MVLPIFLQAYRQGNPPWDIGRAQPAFVELANEGLVQGAVLDMGCGTGDLVLEMAERGHEAWGVDAIHLAIDQAKAKMRLRDLDATFLVGDALEAECLNRTFDTVTDCGLFHVLSDPERVLYEQQLRAVTHPGSRLLLMAMSDWEDAAWGGPRRVSQQELIDTFGAQWTVDDIREARFLTRPGFEVRGHAWLAVLVRDGPGEKKPARRKAAKPPVARRTPPADVVVPAAAGPA